MNAKSNCLYCQHYRVRQTGFKCAAFPGGIPAPIINGQHNHADEFPGDNGIRFKAMSSAQIRARRDERNAAK